MNPPRRYTRFASGISPDWIPSTPGNGAIQASASGIRLLNRGAVRRVYTNAQLDDYRGLSRAAFPWRPPLRLSVRARFSHRRGQLTGTAGFGFWNDPLRMTGLRRLAPPQALWFFYAGPHSDMRLALDQPGWGWKASAVDASNPRFLAQTPRLALSAPLMRVPRLHRRLWPSFQKVAGIAEQTIPAAMQDWHIYTLDWQRDRAVFHLDGRTFLQLPHAPSGPLGLVLWLDNQFLQVAPWGHVRWGLVEKEEAQWLEIDWLAVESGPAVTGRAPIRGR